MSYFPKVERWLIPKSALSSSFREMALDGVCGNEGIALWLGRRIGGRADITHVVALRGPGVIRKPNLLRISDDLMNDVTDLAIEHSVSLVGQIHSHGTGYGINLSPTDRMYGISVPYYLSLVAPHFGSRPKTPIGKCGVHVFEPGGAGFRRLPPDEANRRLEVISGPATPVLLVGTE